LKFHIDISCCKKFRPIKVTHPRSLRRNTRTSTLTCLGVNADRKYWCTDKIVDFVWRFIAYHTGTQKVGHPDSISCYRMALTRGWSNPETFTLFFFLNLYTLNFPSFLWFFAVFNSLNVCILKGSGAQGSE
jgi:hypothetical protein